jgi:hypothetical protein
MQYKTFPRPQWKQRAQQIRSDVVSDSKYWNKNDACWIATRDWNSTQPWWRWQDWEEGKEKISAKIPYTTISASCEDYRPLAIAKFFRTLFCHILREAKQGGFQSWKTVNETFSSTLPPEIQLGCNSTYSQLVFSWLISHSRLKVKVTAMCSLNWCFPHIQNNVDLLFFNHEKTWCLMEMHGDLLIADHTKVVSGYTTTTNQPHGLVIFWATRA